MIQQVTAIYERGVLKPLSPLDLKEQEVVSLSIEKGTDESNGVNGEPSNVAKAPQNESVYEALVRLKLLGCIKNGPADLSTNPKYMEGFGELGR